MLEWAVAIIVNGAVDHKVAGDDAGVDICPSRCRSPAGHDVASHFVPSRGKLPPQRMRSSVVYRANEPEHRVGSTPVRCGGAGRS